MSIPRKDYIPRPDAAFDAWLAAFMDPAANWWGNHGGDGNLDDLRDLQTAWQTAYAASVAADAAARAATAAKNAARIACEEALRPMVRLMQQTPDTTDAERALMGITVYAGGTALASRVPATAPLVSAIIPARLTHTLRFVDAATPTRTAKPRGVVGAELRIALTEPRSAAPSDPDAYRFVGLLTRDTVTHSFTTEDGGKTAAYLLRWLSTTGEPGPWSEICSATIAA